MSDNSSNTPTQADSQSIVSAVEEYIRTQARDVATEIATEAVADHEQQYEHYTSDTQPATSTVGAGGEFETLQAAWDNCPYGSSLSLWIRPDYDPRAEDYPIKFHRNGDDQFKPVTLRGPGPGSVAIGHADVQGDVLSVVGAGPAGYTRPFYAEGVRFEGAKPDADGKGAGLSIQNAPHSMLQGVLFHTQNHGLEVCGGGQGCFGLVASLCQAWNCGGDGFRLTSDAKPHNSQLIGCKAIANKGAGVRWLGGIQGSMYGCDIELNHGYGVGMRGQAVSIKDSYIEGNARAVDYPVEVYGRGANGLTVADCYFHGINPRGASHEHKRVQRAVNLHDSKSVTLRDCVYQRYGDRFFAGFKGTEAQLHPASHHAFDDTPLSG